MIKSICSILMIAIVMFALSCNSNVKPGAHADTSSFKLQKKIYRDFQFEPEGPQWDAAKKLIAQSDCQACHMPFEMLVAPPYIMIAKRYNTEEDTVATLANRIIKGSYGIWPGYTTMNKHAGLSKKDAQIIVKYILAFNQKR